MLQVGNLQIAWRCENIRRMTGFRIESFLKACTMNNVHPWIWHTMVVRQTLQCCFSAKNSLPAKFFCFCPRNHDVPVVLCLVEAACWSWVGYRMRPSQRASGVRRGGAQPSRESVFVVFPHLTWCKGRNILKFCSGILVAGFFFGVKNPLETYDIKWNIAISKH